MRSVSPLAFCCNGLLTGLSDGLYLELRGGRMRALFDRGRIRH
ncbi:hypothetical protein HMPREF1548_06035 [Clostridium sp. KLE 1755]|nr:hypothetical protein HMPREF1548_06035 [Clostridium sp. KLE 1755]